ncbi:MAG: hypothetical protein AVDCRST_MAG49-4346, partial [uncultured Thermomicrobiales bacterium]
WRMSTSTTHRPTTVAHSAWRLLALATSRAASDRTKPSASGHRARPTSTR